MRHVLLVYWVLCLAASPGCAPKAGVDDGGDGPSVSDDPCTDGAGRCEDGAALICDNGHFVVAEQCADVCVDGIGCAACVPGSGSCSGEDATVCLLDGSGYESYECDPLQGLFCEFDSGKCDGPCAPHRLGDSYIGCDYYPTVTANEVRSEFTYAVVISNGNDDPVHVYIEGGALASALMFEVAPHAVHVEALPWVKKLKACEGYQSTECGNPQNQTALVRRGAYHLRTDAPVTVYQYNPLDYQLSAAGCHGGSKSEGCSYSNDASLLLPVTAMTGRYWAASWPNWPGPLGEDWPGFISITATHDATTVTVTSPSLSWGNVDLPTLFKGMPATFTLDKGDVAQFLARREWNDRGDFTGTYVEASQPVQVIGGHFCAETIGVACDHLEESMLPYEALGNDYIVTGAQGVPHSQWPDPEVYDVSERFVRIIATEADTTIEYDPPDFRIAPGQTPPTSIANAGEFVELGYTWFRDSVRIKTNKKVLVAEYMSGQAQSAVGDPAMAVAIPVAQYRTNYSFHAPVNYVTNYVNVVAPLSALIYLDGSTTPLTGFEPIGATGYGLLRVELDNSGDGTHTLEGSAAFGISVYGYGDFTSYWYPGGLDLKPITVD